MQGRHIKRVKLRGGKTPAFKYVRSDTKRAVKDGATLERLRKLGVPPAYTDVRYACSAGAKLQATGVDAKGRVQRRYNDNFTRRKAAEKFDRLAAFAAALPAIRRDAKRMAAPWWQNHRQRDRDALVGGAALLMDAHGVRSGSERYLDENGSHGLTTLAPCHVRARGSGLVLDFDGKSGKRNVLHVTQPTLVKTLKALRVPARKDRLFELADGTCLRGADVNAWLKEYGPDFKTKDFRTWRANAAFVAHMLKHGHPAPDTVTATKRLHAAAVRHAAEFLGNTPAVCKKNYVHGELSAWVLEDPTDFVRVAKRGAASKRGGGTFTAPERALMTLLQHV